MTEDEVDLDGRLKQLIGGFKDTQLLYVAVKIGLIEELLKGGRNAVEVSRSLGAHSSSLLRIMRGLVNRGILIEPTESHFELTPLGHLLASSNEAGYDGLTIRSGEMNYAAWAQLMHTATTGESAFEQAHGTDFFGYLSQDTSSSNSFNRSMLAASRKSASAVSDQLQFEPDSQVVDVGGGGGALAREILLKDPSLHLTLLETPSVIPLARENLSNLQDRVKLIEGDFFRSIPPADAHVMQAILHDWDDAHAAKIIEQSGASLRLNGRLLVIEDILPKRIVAHEPLVEIDLMMLVGHSGRERTHEEYIALLEASNFQHTKTIETKSHFKIMDFRLR